MRQVTITSNTNELHGKTIRKVVPCIGANDSLLNYIAIIFTDDTYLIAGIKQEVDDNGDANFIFCDRDIKDFKDDMYDIVIESDDTDIHIEHYFDDIYYLRRLIKEGILTFDINEFNERLKTKTNEVREKEKRYKMYLELKKEFEEK